MFTIARYRLLPVIVMTVTTIAVFSGSGCGGGDQGTSIKVDEKQEKALTDSMRGYFDKESKKETKKETKSETAKESVKK